MKEACEKVHSACDICLSTGLPKPKQKISISHIKTAFNDEIQADFITVKLRGDRYEVLNIVDTGRSYGERAIASAHTADIMMRMLETECLYHHGAPDAFSADPEFCKGFFERFLSSHGIKLRPRPSRSSHKNRKIEQNNGVFKSVISRLCEENTVASAATLVSRASFMTTGQVGNLFHESHALSSFRLARGYSPSLFRIPLSIVPGEILEAHIENTANIAIQKILRSRAHENVRANHLHPGTPVWVFYKSSKQNESATWISALVVEAGQHIVKCRRSKKGPPMMVA